MSRFAAEGHKVLYVEPSHSIIRSHRGREYIGNRVGSSRLTPSSEGVWVLTPSQMVPCVSRPTVSRLNARLLSRQIRLAMQHLDVMDAILWVYPPEFAPATAWTPHSALVADLVDDMVAYEVTDDRKHYVRRCTETLFRSADVALCTTRGLADKFAPEATVVPNGYDADLFNPEVAPVPELASKASVVGFIGTIFRYIDYSLIEAVASRLPDATVVMVGRIADNGPALTRLLSLPNVRHIPPVPRNEVPAYVASFDVCLVPFRVDDVSRNVSPLKAYEYLAMGKPVVSVPMPSLSEDPAAAGIVYAESCEDFVEAVSACLIDCGKGLNEAVAGASWDGRYQSVRDAVGALLVSEDRR